MKKALMMTALATIMAATSANATLTWTPPITIDSHNIVGAASAVTGEEGGQGAVATVAAVARNILNLGESFTGVLADTRTYRSGITAYSGSITEAPFTKLDDGGTSVPAGWKYVIAKYDGTQAGYVLFELNGEGAILPTYSWSVWNATTGQGNEVENSYAISGWTAFNSVPAIIVPAPEPATVIAGALLLLPFGASTLRILRKNRAA